MIFLKNENKNAAKKHFAKKCIFLENPILGSL